jgi:hypothetical protein
MFNKKLDSIQFHRNIGTDQFEWFTKFEEKFGYVQPRKKSEFFNQFLDFLKANEKEITTLAKKYAEKNK